MSDGYFCGAKKVASGDICTSSEHLLALPRQNNIAGMHRFGLASRRVQRRCNIGCCVHGKGKEGDKLQCDALITHHVLNSQIGMNKN
jgi:hypothetical protein